MISIASQVSRVIHLSYTGRHIYQRTNQLWRVVTSQDLYRFIRLIIFIVLDMLLGLCLAHMLRRLFLTPQRSIGNFLYCIFHSSLTFNFYDYHQISPVVFVTNDAFYFFRFRTWRSRFSCTWPPSTNNMAHGSPSWSEAQFSFKSFSWKVFLVSYSSVEDISTRDNTVRLSFSSFGVGVEMVLSGGILYSTELRSR